MKLLCYSVPDSRYLAVAVMLVGAVQPVKAQQVAPGITKWADSLAVLIAKGQEEAPGSRTLDEAIALADRVLTVTPRDGVMLHYKGYAIYRKANSMLAANASEDAIKEILEEADTVLEQASQILRWPETFALRSSVLGQIIGVSGMLAGMRLGPKADALMDEAVELGPSNPRVFMLRGVGSIYKPKMFGGGTDKAVADLLKAAALFPTETPASPAPRWGHAEVYAWLGQAYVVDKKFSEARHAYQKALQIAPEFGWVTNVLLPELEKKAR